MAVSKKPEMTQAMKIHKAPEKQLEQANVQKKSTSQPPNDLANATSSKSDKTVADVIVSKRKSVGKIQRKQYKTRARGLVRRSKTGKGRRRRRRRMPTVKSSITVPVGLKEEISAGPSWQPKEDGAGCYCQELKEGVRQEGAVRGQFLEGKVLEGEDKVEEDKVEEDNVNEDKVHGHMTEEHVQDKGQDGQVLEREVQGSRDGAGIRCWVCRLRGMAKKCKQLRGNRI